jgi:glucosyl-3-phosphoglycerate synthase
VVWAGSYDYPQFADPVPLTRRKYDLGPSVSVLLPCLQATPATEPLIDEIHALNEQAPLVDQIAAVAVNSSQDMGAACPDVEVYSANELMPEYGPVIGNGDAMWRALSIARGDLVDANVESPAFESSFVRGVLGPILSDPRMSFGRAAYARRLGCTQNVFETEVDGALTELMSRPLSTFLTWTIRIFAATVR